MRLNRLALGAIAAAALLTAATLHGLGVASSQTLPPSVNQQSIDSTTVDRLSRLNSNAGLPSIRATTDVTGTLAATLAAELLLTPVNFGVNLPIVMK